MKTILKNGLIEYVSRCDSLRVDHNGHIIRIDKEKVTIHAEGVQYAQYWLIEHESNTNILPFMAETPRYRPENKKIYVSPVQVYFNALADNFINIWKNFFFESVYFPRKKK